jgi:tetratricopeptide (TPR) repeat protein
MPQPDARLSKEAISEAKTLMDQGEMRKASEILDRIIGLPAADTETKKLLARALTMMARILVFNNLPMAKDCSEKALSLSKDLLDRSLEAEALCAMSNVAWKLGEFTKALEHLAKALDIDKAIKDKRLEGIARIEKGTILTYQGDMDAAEREFREAILALEKAGDQAQMARAYNNLGDCYIATKKYDRAAEMFTKCKKFSEKTGNKMMLAWGASNLGDCHLEMGRYEAAKTEFEQALPYFERTRDIRGLIAVNQAYGLVCAKIGNWDKADEHFTIALRLTQKNKSPVDEGKTYVRMATMYSWRGDKEKARRYLEKAIGLFERHGADQDKAWAEKQLKEHS